MGDTLFLPIRTESFCYASNLLEEGYLGDQTELRVVGTATKRFILENERRFHEVKLSPTRPPPNCT